MIAQNHGSGGYKLIKNDQGYLDLRKWDTALTTLKFSKKDSIMSANTAQKLQSVV
jgi:hypothetical protein